MSNVGRTWKLWAHRYGNGELWHIGEHWWVELFGLQDPIVPVLVEIVGDLYSPEVTHYGWMDADPRLRQRDDAPSMIQVRAGNDPANPKRALMLLDMCFAYGVDAAVKDKRGSIVALRITEREQ